MAEEAKSMATIEQCEVALGELAAKLAAADSGTKSKALDRSLSCTVRDLDVVFAGQLHDGALNDIHRVEPGDSQGKDAQIRLSLDSDDLLALTAGTLDFTGAWLKGRIKLDASFSDLLKLKSLL
jgi:predicted lipid carrier protein YhbT